MKGHENPGRPCPLCGGELYFGTATIPFVLGKNVAVIKDVPAEVCESCGEPFLHAEATDSVSELLAKARSSGAEVTVMSYGSASSAAA